MLRQFKPPLANGTSPFKWQVTLIAQARFEQPAVILGITGDNRLDSTNVVDKACIITVCVLRVIAGGKGTLTELVLQERQCAVDTGVGTSNTGQREAHRLETPHI